MSVTSVSCMKFTNETDMFHYSYAVTCSSYSEQFKNLVFLYAIDDIVTATLMMINIKLC